MQRYAILLYPSLLAYGMAFTFSPTFDSGFQLLQTDPGDTVLNHYFLEHSWRCVSQPDYKGELWSPPFYYPAPEVLAYSDNLFGGAPLYWLFRAFGSEVRAYQLWMMASFVLSFVAMALVLRWFGLSHSLCALGAFLFAFHTYPVQQLGHQQLCPRWWFPFGIWYTWRFLQQPSGWLLYCAGFCIAAQFITAVYIGWFLGFALGLVCLCALIFNQETRSRIGNFVRNSPISAIVPVLLNAVLVGAVAIPYMRVNRGSERTFGDALTGLPHWNSWLSAPPGTLWSSLLEPVTMGKGGEGYLFSGVCGLILLIVAAVVAWRAPRADFERVWIQSILLGILLIAILTLSVWIDDDKGGSLWFLIFETVPGADAIRAVCRIFLVVHSLLVVGGLIAVQRLMNEMPLSAVRRGGLIAALTLLALAENYFPQRDDRTRSFEHAGLYDEARRIGEEIRGLDAVYGFSPIESSSCHHELKMMWAGLYGNVPVINGYSGRYPKGYAFAGYPVSVDSLRDWLGKEWRGRLLLYNHSEKQTETIIVFDE